MISIPRCEPWCWNIYLQNWVICGVNVGKYSIHGASGIDILQGGAPVRNRVQLVNITTITFGFIILITN